MNTIKWFLPCLIPIIFGFTIPFWEENMETAVLAAIITGAIAIVVAVIGFIGSCKSSNGVTREARDRLSKEQSDAKNQLSKEHTEFKNELSKELGGQLTEVRHLIDKDISVKEVKMQLFSDKQKDIAKTVDDVNCFLKDWEQKTIEANELKKENETLNKKISELTVANSEQVSQLRSELTKANAVINQQSEMLHAFNSEQDYELER